MRRYIITIKKFKYNIFIEKEKEFPDEIILAKDISYRIKSTSNQGFFYKKFQVSFMDMNFWWKNHIKAYDFNFSNKKYRYVFLTPKEYSKEHQVFCKIYDQKKNLIGKVMYNYILFFKTRYILEINAEDDFINSILALAIIMSK